MMMEDCSLGEEEGVFVWLGIYCWGVKLCYVMYVVFFIFCSSFLFVMLG